MITEGEPELEPLRYPGYKSQYLAGTHAATATMGALFSSISTRLGQEVDVSIIECLSSLPEGAGKLMGHAFTGEEVVRVGYRAEGLYPLGYYPCKDGAVHVFGITGGHWPRIAEWMGMPELAEDPRFTDPVQRLENEGEFEVMFLGFLMEKTQAELFRTAQEHRLPVAPMNLISNVLEDPQFKAREAFVEIDHPITGTVTYPGVPFKLPEVPSSAQLPAPTLGQHNHEIYCDRLGYEVEELKKFTAEGII